VFGLGRRRCAQWLNVFRQWGNCSFRNWKLLVHPAAGSTLYSRKACSVTPDFLVSVKCQWYVYSSKTETQQHSSSIYKKYEKKEKTR